MEPEHERNKVILRTDRLKALSGIEGNRINYNSGRKEGAQLPVQFTSGHTLHQTPSWYGGSGALGATAGCCPPQPRGRGSEGPLLDEQAEACGLKVRALAREAPKRASLVSVLQGHGGTGK